MSHNILSSKILSILLVVNVITVGVKSNSAGTGYACVDAVNLCKLPCPDDGETRPWTTKDMNGISYPCCPLGMDLVAPPTKSDNYLVTTSSKDGTYNPCEVMTVTVKTLAKDGKYLGLLLYAVEDSGDKTVKTGQWILPKSDNPKFWTPPACKGKAVMHKNAGVKHFSHSFKFRAPTKGRGPIRFRALVKHGETNGGSFFWPSQDVILQEATNPPKSTIWIEASEKDISCKTACEKKGSSCDGEALKTVISKGKDEQFSNDIDGPGKSLVCRPPLLSHNGQPCSELPLLSIGDGYCSTRDDLTNCPVDANANLLCESKNDATSNAKRLCPCKVTNAIDECDVAGATPGGDGNGNTNGDKKKEEGNTAEGDEPVAYASSASSIYHFSSTPLISCLSLLIFVVNTNIVHLGNGSRNSRNISGSVLTTLVLFSVFVIKFTSAHNWINNPASRIKGLTKVGPCPPRPGNSVNIAVNKNQDFHLEWSIVSCLFSR
jgi:hypothetical protein